VGEDEEADEGGLGVSEDRGVDGAGRREEVEREDCRRKKKGGEGEGKGEERENGNTSSAIQQVSEGRSARQGDRVVTKELGEVDRDHAGYEDERPNEVLQACEEEDSQHSGVRKQEDGWFCKRRAAKKARRTNGRPRAVLGTIFNTGRVERLDVGGHAGWRKPGRAGWEGKDPKES
jgi:hypothetical protein